MLVFTNPQLSEAVTLLGWDGRQLSGEGRDYLMVVDANLGNKSNRSIIRQTTYDVQLQADNSVVSRLSLIYDYSATRADADPAVNPGVHGAIDYNNLLQIFTPVNTSLTSTSDTLTEVIRVPEAEHTRLVTRFTLPFDSSERFQFQYTAPDVIETVGTARRYTLVIQKQPGIQPDVVNVQIALPPGAALVSATPTPDATYTIETQILEFRLELQTDLAIEVVFAPAP